MRDIILFTICLFLILLWIAFVSLVNIAGGGSACLSDGDTVVTATGENRAIANAWAAMSARYQSALPSTETGEQIMNGIDISNWQKDLDLKKIDYDFVIVKATEGLNFVDKYCDGFIQTAKAMNKKWEL